MEEYEVRASYARESYPGKDIVRAWFDDAINPLLSRLTSELRVLTDTRWSWNSKSQAFTGLDKLTTPSSNEEDFIERYPEIEDAFKRHDDVLAQLNSKGEKFFRRVADSTYLHDELTRACTEESLLALTVEYPNRFREKPGPGMLDELFGRNRDEDELLRSFAEWTINGLGPQRNDSLYLFWDYNRQQFLQLLIFPPLSEYREQVQSLRGKLKELDEEVAASLKAIRRELSEEHKVPFQTPRVQLNEPNPYYGR